MSTDLYGVRVLEVDQEARRLRLRVFVVYYDTHYEYHQPVPEDRSFFVRVLGDKDALAADISHEERFDESYLDRNAFRYVDRFVELERRNFPVTSYEDYHDFYYERGGGWQDEEQLVQADYDVFVTRPEYLTPFEVGDTWGTTAYQTSADALTFEDYPHVPDLHDARTFVPFGDQETERSVVERLSFSADGALLLASHNEGGWRVFSVEDLSVVAEAVDVGDWSNDPGWTADGRVAWREGEGFVAQDLETGAREPVEVFGRQASSTGRRFLRESSWGSEQERVLDERGEVLFELSCPPETVTYAAFDAAGQRAVIKLEGGEALVVDLDEGVARPISQARINGLGMSPDGRYIVASSYGQPRSGGGGIMVIRVEDGEVVRALEPDRQRIATAAAWSPTGDLVATSTTSLHGHQSQIQLHRTGRALQEAARTPRPLPPRGPRTLADLARLYVAQTAAFSSGWSTHLDDDRMDMHLTMQRAGGDTHDLVEHMASEVTRIATRAYESIIARERGDIDHADWALAQAETMVERAEIAPWSMTYVYAPLAAAQRLAGREDVAEASWRLAQEQIEEEANPFQKRTVAARALLAMGRVDEVRALIDAEETQWIGSCHKRLFSDLLDAGEEELFRHAFVSWGAQEDWSSVSHVSRMLLARGLPERAVDLDWLGVTQYKYLERDSWKTWFEQDPEAARAHFQATSNTAREGGWGEVAAILEGDHTGEEGQARFERLCLEGCWGEVYDEISATRQTLRNPMYQAVVQAALARGDHDIAFDALAQLPCTDMNSVGLRALQDTFRRMAGLHYHAYHP